MRRFSVDDGELDGTAGIPTCDFCGNENPQWHQTKENREKKRRCVVCKNYCMVWYYKVYIVRGIRKMKSKKPMYIKAVNWIAGNDEPGEMDWANMVDLVSVVLIADLFDVAPKDVALDIIAVRLGEFKHEN